MADIALGGSLEFCRTAAERDHEMSCLAAAARDATPRRHMDAGDVVPVQGRLGWEDARVYEELFGVKRWMDRLPEAERWCGGGFAKGTLARTGADYLRQRKPKADRDCQRVWNPETSAVCRPRLIRSRRWPRLSQQDGKITSSALGAEGGLGCFGGCRNGVCREHSPARGVKPQPKPSRTE